ncbi:MFS transporter [Halobacillus sp. HZG1]|uniref:MFS transporter n=1 Tax=Halobacillus sp. HZG1 TaxID=3111769 RepID=UPI002DBF6CA2|nr:MFS transporter [Halobacillus sp. HZG1]MEC3883645.1 MFS transporter [Halobacillus sp. HZG1]
MYRSLWKQKNIRFYLLGGGVSRLGDVLSAMAFLFLAYDMTGSNVHTTGVALAETVPYLLFGLIGGVVADSFPRKKLLIRLDLLRVPLMLSISLLHGVHLLTYPVLILVSFLVQTIGCFFNPAHRAVLPMVTTEDERSAANSLYDTITRGVTILTPLIAITLLNTVGVLHFFTLDALTYIISVYCLTQLTLEEPLKKSQTIRSIFLSIKDFFVWMVRQTTIRNLFFFTFYTVFLNTWVWQVGLLLALEEMTTKSEEWYSGIQGVFGATVIITNMVLPFFIKRFSLHHYVAGAAIWGFGIAYYGFFYGVGHFFIGCIIVGVGMPVASLARVFLIQSEVPEEKMGRAFSTNAVLLYASNTLSLMLYGVLSAYMPIRWLMFTSGGMIVAGCLILTTIHVIKLSKLRGRFLVDSFK